jgi:hypothetical protein
MKRSILFTLSLCSLVILATRLPADDKADKEKALEEVKKLKGTVVNFPFSISFDGKGITDDDLACVEKIPDLEGIYLRKCKVTDKGLEHLKDLTKMKILFLNDNPVTDKGLEQLKKMTKLENLNLSGTQITDEGLGHLKDLKGLKILEVKKTKVTDTGIADLKKALPDLLVRQ